MSCENIYLSKWFPDRSDPNRAIKSQKLARSFTCILEVEGLHYLCSEINGADEMRVRPLVLFSNMQEGNFLMTRLILKEGQ